MSKIISCNACKFRNRCSLLIEQAERHVRLINELPSQFDTAVNCGIWTDRINRVKVIKLKPQLHKHITNNRFYFRKDDDTCYTIKNHLQYMIENHIEEMDIFLAKRETDSGYFFCKHLNEVGEKSEGGCGKMCKAYQPRNGKSGACKFVGYIYEQTNKCFSLKADSV